MLILATLPNILSWFLVGLASHSVVALIMSRVLAGISIGLMASNVYIADVASTKNIVFGNRLTKLKVQNPIKSNCSKVSRIASYKYH